MCKWGECIGRRTMYYWNLWNAILTITSSENHVVISPWGRQDFSCLYFLCRYLRDFGSGSIESKKNSIWPFGGILPGTNALDKSESISNGNSNLPQSPEFEVHHQMQFSLIPLKSLFNGWVLSLCNGEDIVSVF